MDNSVGTFLSADPTTMNLIGRAYELRHLVFGFPDISSQTLKSSDIQTLPSAREHTIRSERSSTVNSGRRFEAVATFRLIWWNQGSGSRKKLSIWRPTIPEGMVYFGDIAVKGYVIHTVFYSSRHIADLHLMLAVYSFAVFFFSALSVFGHCSCFMTLFKV